MLVRLMLAVILFLLGLVSAHDSWKQKRIVYLFLSIVLVGLSGFLISQLL